MLDVKNTKLVCLYCAKVFTGGGINRFKQHLAGAKGEVEQCRKCPPDVRHQMVLNLKPCLFPGNHFPNFPVFVCH